MDIAGRNNHFLTCLLLNMLLNLDGTIPGCLLLGLHIWLDISIWWSVGAFALWILGLLIKMRLLGWASDCGNRKDPPKENKNPYSVKNTDNYVQK